MNEHPVEDWLEEHPHPMAHEALSLIRQLRNEVPVVERGRPLRVPRGGGYLEFVPALVNVSVEPIPSTFGTREYVLNIQCHTWEDLVDVQQS